MGQLSPVFIVGAERSGTSILYRIIQKHPVFMPQECTEETKVDLTESFIFRNPYLIYDGNGSAPFRYMLKNRDLFTKLMETTHIVKIHQRPVVFKKIFYRITNHTLRLQNSELLKKLMISYWCHEWNDVLVRNYFYYAQRARGVHRIVEKTPSHIFHISEIINTFNHAKLLFIYRHPIDVFSSYRIRLVNASRRGLN